MNLFSNRYLEQINMMIEQSNRPGMDSGILWLNPLLRECVRRS